MEEYVAEKARWVSVWDMPEAVFKCSPVAWNGKLLVVGVYTNEGVIVSSIFEYDLNGTWKTMPSLLFGRYRPVVTVVRGDVVVLGGFSSDVACSDLAEICGSNDVRNAAVERYNQQSQCWELMNPTYFDWTRAVTARCEA